MSRVTRISSRWDGAMLDPVLTLLQEEHPYTAPSARTRCAYLLHEAVHHRPHSTRSTQLKKVLDASRGPKIPPMHPRRCPNYHAAPP